ncbi:uncharacterized protein LOC133739464 [Rosa rugosa]|uniref:uncharacterized protein LOC133739464 n=1 Tax=Rosa rugosa TaxID=74645 RepID=UPI002B41019A|nr:uncharacterized protein LOC133739464 [Rosa rugosa]
MSDLGFCFYWTDKASMLDEAVEYLKQLQLQVQLWILGFQRGERKKQKKGETGRTEEAGKSKRREELLYFTDSRICLLEQGTTLKTSFGPKAKIVAASIHFMMSVLIHLTNKYQYQNLTRGGD